MPQYDGPSLILPCVQEIGLVRPPGGWTPADPHPIFSERRFQAVGRVREGERGLSPPGPRSDQGIGPRRMAHRHRRVAERHGSPRHDRPQARTLVKVWIGALQSCLIADRAYDRDAFRAGVAQQGIQDVMPARARCLEPQPHDLEAYRRATQPQLAQGWRRAATRYDPIRTSLLGLPVLGRGAWIWMKSKFCTTWGQSRRRP